jgi:hypothetical protein
MAVGVLLLLEYTEVLDAGEVIGSWWPVVLIAAGLLSLTSNPRHWIGPALVVGLGGALLLRTTEVVDTLEVVGPALLVLFGVAVIFGKGFTQRSVASENRINSFNVFSGSELASKSDHFEGGSIGALFGGAEVDLRDAKPAPGAELDVFVAFGGAEITVPEGWHVVTHGMPIFGGFDNVTAKEKVAVGAPTLDVNATVIFGGLEVKH